MAVMFKSRVTVRVGVRVRVSALGLGSSHKVDRLVDSFFRMNELHHLPRVRVKVRVRISVRRYCPYLASSYASIMTRRVVIRL